MSDDAVSDAEASSDQASAEQQEDSPRGTLLIASLFLVALVVTWTAMYFMMLSRS